MKIKLIEVTIRDLFQGYVNNKEEGVYGYDGKLNIRPKYQREFIYKPKQQEAVIDTVTKNFPLNVMYWIDNEDGTYELLDGQQRTLSICEYLNGAFSRDFRFFHNLDDQEKNQLLDYKLMIYFCTGTNQEKLEWFKTINIAGEKLTAQELRNAIYTGKWLTDAKRYFSKTGCPAYAIAKDYMKGAPIRQDYLETVLKWISKNNIEEYMAVHQNDNNANELWLYFQSIVSWVNILFPNYRKEMKGVDWGALYDNHKDDIFDSSELEKEVVRLIMDDEVTNRTGIYNYVINKNEKYLSIRAFTVNQKRKVYEKQKGICTKCNEHFEFKEMEGDHITPWSQGGKTNEDNCQMMCKQCNRRKSDK